MTSAIEAPIAATYEQRIQTLEHWLSVASELIAMLTAMQSTVVNVQRQQHNTQRYLEGLAKETHRRLDLISVTLQTAVETQQSIERLLVKVYDPVRAKPTPFDVGPEV